MYNKYHTKGIVLSNYELGEGNSGLIMFSRDFGLVHAFAVGTRKVGSKIRQGVQPFCLGEYSLIHTKRGIKIVGQKVFSNFFEDLRFSKEKLFVLNKILSLLRRLGHPSEDDKELYDYVLSGLLEIKSIDSNDLVPLELLIVARILNAKGILEHVDVLNGYMKKTISKELLKEVNKDKVFITRIINSSIKSSTM